jgi:Putative peptidoglycan binding domain
MAGEPTLYPGDEGKDGWVEYLQSLLAGRNHLYLGKVTTGVFDEMTLGGVKAFQEVNHLKKVDGIVGDETWSALRGEPIVKEPGDDGREPGSYVEHGLEMRFTNEIDYIGGDDDLLWFRASSVGDVQPAEGTIKPFIHLRLPDGSSRQLTAEHEHAFDLLHEFRARAVTNGVRGHFGVLIQLPQESGGDTMQYEFIVMDDGSVRGPD